MKELFENLEIKGFEEKNLVLLDTCFVFSLLDRNKKLLPGYKYGLSSFTVEELLKVGHRLKKFKVELRRFVKDNDLVVIDTPVHIGDWEGEKEFVRSVDPELLKHIADASDAVLLAVALKTSSIVLTKDKHHLFTAELLNYLRDSGVDVFKELKDLEE